MSRKATIEREERLRPFVVGASVVPLALFIIGVVFQSSVVAQGDTLPSLLRTIDANTGSIIIGSLLTGIAFMLLAVPLLYIFRAAQARSENVLGGLVVLPVIGPVFYGIQNLIFAFAQIDVSSKFADQQGGVGDVYTLASNLSEDSGAIVAAGLLQFVGIMASIIATIYVPLWGARTGLLTRFQGTLGMALGGSLILILLGGSAASTITFPALFGWFAYFGLQLAGRTKKGRPPAWDAGEAMPWPGPGEEPVAAGVGGPDIIEGDASEIPGVGENPNAARRDRARKRKRKRRR